MKKFRYLGILVLVLCLIIAIPAVILANDSSSDIGDVAEYGGNVYNAGTLNVLGGRIRSGVALYGGNVFNQSTGIVNIYDGAQILNGFAFKQGANVYSASGSVLNNAGFVGNSTSDKTGVSGSVRNSCICGSKTEEHAVGCNGDVTSIKWQAWNIPNILPSDTGYWYLTGDVIVTKVTQIPAGNKVCIDLNGHTIFRTDGDRIFNMFDGEGTRLIILDTVGTGRIELGSATATGALIAVDNANTFTLYGGTVNGANVDYNVEKPGAVIRVLGADSVVNIHGGTVIGGKAAFGGGAIGVSGGTLNMTAGLVKDGTGNRGGNIYIAPGAMLNLSGTASVTGGTATESGYADSGNIYLAIGAGLNVDESFGVVDKLFRAANPVLKVGYGKGVITPTEDVQMYGGTYTGTTSELYLLTVAFQDEKGNTFVHIVADLLDAGRGSLCKWIREAAQEQLGISGDYITVGSTHTHSGVTYNSEDPANERWRQNVLIPQAIASIEQALNDLAPAEMYIGRTKTDRLNFVRRYWLTDGTLYEGFTSNRDSEISSHETEADEELQLVKFVRAGKEDVLMVNWQAHATKLTSNGTNASSDYVGYLRERVESELSVKCVFYQGAAGNVVPTSRIKNEAAITTTGLTGTWAVGLAVANNVIDAYNSDIFTKVNTGIIHNKRIYVDGVVVKYSDEMIANAQKVLEYSETVTDHYEIAAYAAQFGIETIYHAQRIITNSKLPDTVPYELNVISIGDVAFVTLPMEFLDTSGMQIKNSSPFDMTVILGYSCTNSGYCADEVAYSNGGYESYNTLYVKGTAEIAVGHHLDMLNEFYPRRLY